MVNASVVAAGDPGYDVFIDLTDSGLNQQELGEHLEALARDATIYANQKKLGVITPCPKATSRFRLESNGNTIPTS